MFGRYPVLLSLCLAFPAAAQTAPKAQEIVVTGKTGEPSSDWKRAETDHVIVFGEGSDGELKRLARNLELLHQTLSRLYRRGETTDDALKPQIILVRADSTQAAALHAREGPFTPPFSSRWHDDARDNGDVLVLAGSDQTIRLDTSRRFHSDCDEYQAEGGTESCGAKLPRITPLVRSWEASLYSAFAQHFMLTYLPQAYPRWYIDGVGALFSTFDVQRGGAIDYAEAPEGLQHVFRSYGYPDLAAILSGRYLEADKPDPRWSPYGAWLLTHYFVYSTLKPERSRQFRDYMAAIRDGTPMAEAVAIFGDLGRLQREVQGHAESKLHFAHVDGKAAQATAPQLATLSVQRGVLIEARAELAIRLGSAAAGTDWIEAFRGRIAPRELIRQGNMDLARRVLLSITNGPYDTPEKRTAIGLLAPPAAAARR